MQLKIQMCCFFMIPVSISYIYSLIVKVMFFFNNVRGNHVDFDALLVSISK